MTSPAAIYSRVPVCEQAGIPGFLSEDRYVENYETIARDHLDHLGRTGRNQFIEERLWQEAEDATANLLTPHLGGGTRVLDIGVGLGRLLARFPRAERHGIDISQAYLEVAKSNGIQVCRARVEDLPYHDACFDVVVCTDVLEHVLDLHAACREALRVLKPSGLLVVRVPYREDLSSYLAPGYPYIFAHLRNFDEHSFRLLFERIFACAVEEIRFCGMMPDPNRYRGRRTMGRILSRPMLGLRRFFPPIHRWLYRAFYLPVEMVAAVRKTGLGDECARAAAASDRPGR